MLITPDTLPHRIYGHDVAGPVLPGDGPVIQTLSYEFGIAAVRYTGGHPPTAVYVLRDGEDAWERLYVS